MKFGLAQHIIDTLIAVFEENPKVDKALVFGSRAKGNYRPDSDIDIALKGEDLSTDDIIAMGVAFEENGIPHKVDLISYHNIKEPDLKDHIDRVGIEMYSRWMEYKIFELGKVVTGNTPSSKFPEEFGYEMPFVTPTDYKNYNKWIYTADRYLSNKGIVKLKNKVLPPNSILVTCIGSDMGKIAINKIPVVTNQQINSVIINDKVNSNFLYYKLVASYDVLRTYGEAGTAVPIVNKGDFENIEITIPTDLKEQTTIASILSSLDDKIDLLRRQNKTLEQLAETLFRQWFVEEAEESWEESILEDWILFDPREKLGKEKNYKVFDMKCLSNTDMSIGEGIIRQVSSATIFRNGDTLLAKITPCLENGKTGFVMHLKDDEVAKGSTEFIVMRSKGQVSPYWVYCLARSKDFRDSAIQSMTGTSGRQRVQINLLRNYEVSVDLTKMKEFHSSVQPVFQKIKSNTTQIHTLTQLRDTLLPKLMSGEVRVKM